MLPKPSRCTPIVSVVVLSCFWIVVIATARWALADDCEFLLCKETKCHKLADATCYKFTHAVADNLHSVAATGGVVVPMEGVTDRWVCTNDDCEPECEDLPANTFPNCGTGCVKVSGTHARTECKVVP